MPRARLRSIAALAAAALCIPAVQAAGGDPAAGREKSQSCAACHGENGRSGNTAYPMLAGQHESYLYHSLKSYKNGDRQNAVMSGMVANLSDEDLRDLAAYYASREPAVHTAPGDGGQ